MKNKNLPSISDLKEINAAISHKIVASHRMGVRLSKCEELRAHHQLEHDFWKDKSQKLKTIIKILGGFND